MYGKDLAVYHLFVFKEEVFAQVEFPNNGTPFDVVFRAFPPAGDGKYLLVAPDFGWSSHVSYFDDFDITDEERLDSFYSNYVGGYCEKMGDIPLDIPNFQPHIKELRLIFSMMLTLLYKHLDKDNRRFTEKRPVEEQIQYCRSQLEELGVYVCEPEITPLTTKNLN